MAFRVLAHLAMLLVVALCAEALTCIGGESLTCTPNCDQISKRAPLWIETCEEEHQRCFNATSSFDGSSNGVSYVHSRFGCVNSDRAENDCREGLSILQMTHNASAVAFGMFKVELNLTINVEEYQVCLCTTDNCNGVLTSREVADNNNRASSVVWPVVIFAGFASLVLIGIGAAVSLCT